MECTIQTRDNKGIKKLRSETSSSTYLWHTSQLKEGIQKHKIREEIREDTGFLLILLLKMKTGFYPALKNGLLQKLLSRVGHKKDNCTPHMHNVVQNNLTLSIPHKSEMT